VRQVHGDFRLAPVDRAQLHGDFEAVPRALAAPAARHGFHAAQYAKIPRHRRINFVSGLDPNRHRNLDLHKPMTIRSWIMITPARLNSACQAALPLQSSTNEARQTADNMDRLNTPPPIV
jgi:hypothetical protein